MIKLKPILKELKAYPKIRVGDVVKVECLHEIWLGDDERYNFEVWSEGSDYYLLDLYSAWGGEEDGTIFIIPRAYFKRVKDNNYDIIKKNFMDVLKNKGPKKYIN